MKNPKLLIAAVALVGIAAVILLAREKRKVEPVKPPVEITAVLPLTGPLADLGENERTGMMLALADLDTKGQRRISFRFEDSQGKGATAVTIVQKAWNIDNQRIFVIATTGPALATIPFFKDHKEDKVVIAQTMYPNVTKDLPFVFRLFPSSAQEAALLADHAIKSGRQKVAILHINNEWGVESVGIFRKRLEASGAVVSAIETFSFGDKDFRTMLGKLAATKPDAVLIYSYPDFFPTILDQYKALGLTYPVLANTDFAVGNIQNRVPAEVLAKTVFPAPRYFYEADTPEIRDFNQRVTAAKHHPNFDIATFYDMTMILNKAAELAEDGSPASFSAALNRALPYHGITGDIKSAGNRDVEVNFSLARWHDGRLELIKPE